MSEANQIQDPFIRKRVVRLRTVTLGFVLVAVIIAAKLFHVQLINRDVFELMAKRQYERRVTLDAERGTIYDRNMNKIAVNLINYSFAADPSFMEESDKDRVAENFARVFSKPKSQYRALLSRKSAFVWLERKVSESAGRQIADSIKGLIKLQTLRRHYPHGRAAAALVGFTNIDNEGVSGLELQYQAGLGGENGWAILQADALGRLLPNPDYPHKAPVDGKDMVLTIDINYQTIALEELEKSVQEYDADDGMVVIMAPKTGEILAMVNYPSFDPNAPEKANPSHIRNRAITDIYEPGSTFKAFSAVAALEEKVRNPDDRIYCENGQMKVYNHIIHDSKKHGTLTFTEVVEKSSNIGIIKTTSLLGSDRFYQYVRAFGFGNETGVDLDGELKGQLKHPTTWSGLSLPMISIGQEIGVTALQLANAYSAIANGGQLNRPFLVRHLTDRESNHYDEKEPLVSRSVASAETMHKVSKMLREVVMSGTGRRVQIKGVEIAGKTGTSQKVEQGSRTYSRDHYTASFAGFFPVENPQLVFLVIINNPRKSIWGEASSAVTARHIIEQIIHSSDDFARTINRVMAEQTMDSTAANPEDLAPDVKYLTVEAAGHLLDKLNIEYRVKGSGDMVVDQSWIEKKSGERVLTLTTGQAAHDAQNDPDRKGYVRVPDVRGLSLRMAINRLYESGIGVRLKGSGYVVAQYPRPGSSLRNGETCVLQCKPVFNN